MPRGKNGRPVEGEPVKLHLFPIHWKINVRNACSEPDNIEQEDAVCQMCNGEFNDFVPRASVDQLGACWETSRVASITHPLDSGSGFNNALLTERQHVDL